MTRWWPDRAIAVLRNAQQKGQAEISGLSFFIGATLLGNAPRS